MAPDSERLELLEPFPAWDGRDIHGLRVLLKARGKCTTDHVSPAGQWLTYRGHLTNISQNLFLGVVNAFTDGEAGMGVDARDGSVKPLPDLAREYKGAGIEWIAVGDENYGEGSSREHAAMEPRFMGGRAVLARSFARIAEANLKKQGVLPLTFADPADYDKVRADDLVDLDGLAGAGARLARSRSSCGTPTAPATRSPRTTRSPRSTSTGSRPAPPSTSSPAAADLTPAPAPTVGTVSGRLRFAPNCWHRFRAPGRFRAQLLAPFPGPWARFRAHLLVRFLVSRAGRARRGGRGAW